MTHRERVLTMLSLREPDRVPRGLGLIGEKYTEFTQRTGATNPGVYWDFDLSGGVGLQRPEVDWKARFGRYYTAEDEPYDFTWDDYPPEWGIAARPAHFYHFAAPRFPLCHATTLREIEEYPFPDYLGEWGHDHLEADVARQQAEGHPVSAWGQRLFQNAWYLRSRDQLFVDMYENPAMAEAIFAKVVDTIRPLIVRLAASGIDILSLADDIGMQDRMMISPAMWRRWVKPGWAAILAEAKRVNPGLHIFYHTDGDFEPVIPDLLEMGVTMLNTVQPESMDVFRIKREWGHAVALGGTVGVQSTLRFGTPAEVRDTIRRQIELLGAGGGFYLSPANGLEPDVPWENIEAFMAAADEYGWY
jgi:uroporphyrinogen decarboxylase